MKQIVRILLLVLFFLLVAAFLAYIQFSRKDTGLISSIDTQALHDGDIILRKGRSLASMAVCVADDYSGFSHIGIIKTQDGQVYVIHAVPGESKSADKVKMDPLSEFLDPSRASDLMVYRPELPSSMIADALVRLFHMLKREFCSMMSTTGSRNRSFIALNWSSSLIRQQVIRWEKER